MVAEGSVWEKEMGHGLLTVETKRNQAMASASFDPVPCASPTSLYTGVMSYKPYISLDIGLRDKMCTSRAGSMAPQVEMLATKPDNMSSNSHGGRREQSPTGYPLTTTLPLWHVCATPPNR